MIKAIKNFESKEGYVIERENSSEYGLIHYEKVPGEMNIYSPELLMTFDVSEGLEIKDEKALREFLKDYVKDEDVLYVREPVTEEPISNFLFE